MSMENHRREQETGNREPASRRKAQRVGCRLSVTGYRNLLAAIATLALLSGCSILGGPGQPATRYAPDPRVQADPSWPVADWQLSISRPEATSSADSLRIAVRPTPEELQVYKDSAWTSAPPDMVEDAVLRALEDSGKIRAVARQGSGIAADYKLVMDLRRFDSDYSGSAVPNAVIELNVKLLHTAGQDVVAARTFVQSIPAASPAVPDVVDAFSRGLGQIAHDVAGWTLVSGDGHQRMGHKR